MWCCLVVGGDVSSISKLLANMSTVGYGGNNLAFLLDDMDVCIINLLKTAYQVVESVVRLIACSTFISLAVNFSIISRIFSDVG